MRLLLERPRKALPKPRWTNILKTLAQTTFMWGTFLWALPQAIVWLERMLLIPGFQPTGYLGWAIFFVAGTIGLTCGLLFAVHGDGTPLPLDTANNLVILGPYRHIRNPMATMGIIQGIAVGIMLGSCSVVVYSLIGGVVWHTLARPWEEADLVDRFGDEYCNYRTSVPLWYPRIKPYRPVENEPIPDISARTHHAIPDDAAQP